MSRRLASGGPAAPEFDLHGPDVQDAHTVRSDEDLLDSELLAMQRSDNTADHRDGALRLPDGRALAWAEFGNSRGLPTVFLPDVPSTRLAPSWLITDATGETALPHSLRILAVDRPGVGRSDALAPEATPQPAEDLRRMVETLAVGRVAVVGIGSGAVDALAFAARYPALAVSVTAVSPRLPGADRSPRRLRTLGRRARPVAGPLAAWLAAGTRDTDLTSPDAWERLLRRLDPSHRAALAARWRHPHFRAAVAADLAEHGMARVALRAVPAGDAAAVGPDPRTVRVPVQLWHGAQESGAMLAELRSLLETRPHWQLNVVPGGCASLGDWSPVLAGVARSFRAAAA
ncbi:alpha/beta fold hydrolase [Nakamurella leprariae]|uniref:AB hydrolase-1 domain-containing protein n=1 Tax=Nakamurella leprariae TaxID=2803911 RepID=A0A939C371_9ACTN|nr:alpha/beta hydrolase [Nakamurella leprariae]MBM9469089.1 hypothetical protein [Nakamurella leprariae]